jgi:hypothetical protein
MEGEKASKEEKQSKPSRTLFPGDATVVEQFSIINSPVKLVRISI